LWAGLPVLTLMGKAFAGRVAASLLKAVDLCELITHSREDYEALAIGLASEPARLAALKKKLAQNRAASPLFDGRKIARHMEAAFEAMLARAGSGLPPGNLDIAP
jgi:predicted O-linked N-acetylglucosamine transferase (SPINDLY family)